jgi:hypothetical protein
MVYKGHKKNGHVIIENQEQIPEGAELRVEVVAPEIVKPQSDFEWLLSFVGSLDHLPEDTSRNIDHYVYGTPKKK